LATARHSGRKSTSYLAEKNTIKATLLPHFPAYSWGEDCTARPIIDEPGLSLKSEAMPPGTSEAPHYHKLATQYFHIQQGTAHFHLPEGWVKVQSGETLLIPAGLPHCISNQETTTLEFLVLSLPSTDDDRILVSEIPTQT
jgi:mannose-6-phosphate isomerase-like protein (cupin superfamily)